MKGLSSIQNYARLVRKPLPNYYSIDFLRAKPSKDRIPEPSINKVVGSGTADGGVTWSSVVTPS
jgi:hypothetical protein